MLYINPSHSDIVPVDFTESHSRRITKAEKKRYKKQRTVTQAVLQMFNRMADGKPLIIKGVRHEGTVQVMVDNMVSAGLVPEDAGAYYDNSMSGRHNVHVKREIGINVFSEQSVHAKHKIEQALGTAGTKAVHVMGAGLRADENDATVFRDAGLIIAPPGGVNAARQLLNYVAQRQHDEIRPPIIIENSHQFWNPLLKTLGLYNDRDISVLKSKNLEKDFGVYITKNRQETLTIARREMADRRIIPADYPKVSPLFPKDAVFFLATGTAKKCRELQAASKAQGYDIQVRPIDQLVDFFLSPDEDKNSYQGNAHIKVQAALAAWKKMPPAAQQNALKKMGLKPEQCFFIAEDSGIDFKEPNLQLEPEFSGIRHLIPVSAKFPGVETGPSIWGGGGVPDFMVRARQAIERKASVRGEKPNLAVGNTSVLAVVPLQADASGKHPVTMTFAVRDMVLSPVVDVSASSRLKGYDLSDFLYPIGSTKPERESRSWAKESGQRAGALRALAILGGAEQVGSALAIKPVEDYRAAIYVPADDKKSVQKEFRSDARKLTASVQSYPKLATLSDVQQKMFAPHDGIVLSFDNPKDPGDYATRFITYGYVFFSAMVAQQTRDKYILGKMLAVLDTTRQKDDDKIINRLAAMTYDLHRLGAIPQDPTTLWTTFGNVTGLAQSMNDAKKEMFRYPAFSYADGPMVMEEKGRPSTKDYHAAILLTASLKSSAVLEPTQQMTEALCAANIGVVSGAGLNNGGMGVVTHTVQDLAHRGKDVHHTGITTPHIRDFEASGNIEKMVSHYVLTKNIYGRMDGLSRADTALVLPGGAGTLQEMFADLLLMQLAKDSKNQHLGDHRNNQIIVLNTPIIDGGARRGFYDGVLQHMPEKILTDYPVHVAHHVHQAMGLVGTHRDAMRAAGRTTSFHLSGL